MEGVLTGRVERQADAPGHIGREADRRTVLGGVGPSFGTLERGPVRAAVARVYAAVSRQDIRFELEAFDDRLPTRRWADRSPNCIRVHPCELVHQRLVVLVLAEHQRGPRAAI